MTALRRFLVPIDFSLSSKTALRAAIALANRYDGAVEVLHVWALPSAMGPMLGTSLHAGGDAKSVAGASREAAATAMRAFLRDIDLPERFGTRIQLGHPAEIIDDVAARYDLVVMGTHGRTGTSRLLLGSVAERVVRTCPVPVLTLHAESKLTPIERILVPTDFSNGAREAIEHAFALAAEFGAKVDLFNSAPIPAHLAPIRSAEDAAIMAAALAEAAQQEMRQLVASVSPPPNVELGSVVKSGGAAEMIAAASKDYDLVVMSTHGRTGVAGIALGSVASKVVRNSRCGVLTTRMSRAAQNADKQTRKRQREEEATVYATFKTVDDALKAYEKLTDANVPSPSISLILDQDEYEQRLTAGERTLTKDGAVTGGLIGGTVGGYLALVGVLSGGSALLLIGPAVALSVTSGLVGALAGLGMADDEAQIVYDQVVAGGALVGVHLKDQQQLEGAEEILFQCGGERAKIAD